MTAIELAPHAWALLTVSALIVGLSKTALPGGNTIAIAIFAAILPARESTGALLVLLIVGDLLALWMYRQHANWAAIWRLAPAVIAGLLLGAIFLAVANDGGVRRVIGVLLLVVVALTLWRRRVTATTGAAGSGSQSTSTRTSSNGGSHPGGRLASLGYGALGGFTTMVANAGGPVMSMYFLAARFPVREFLGTAAWFFAIVNIVKLPFSIGLGLITGPSLLVDLVLVPGVLIGGLCGRWIAGRMPQRVFERAVLVLTVVGAVYLLF